MAARLFLILATFSILTACAGVEKKPESCVVPAALETSGMQYPKNGTDVYKPTCYGPIENGKCIGPHF